MRLGCGEAEISYHRFRLTNYTDEAAARIKAGAANVGRAPSVPEVGEGTRKVLPQREGGGDQSQDGTVLHTLAKITTSVSTEVEAALGKL